MTFDARETGNATSRPVELFKFTGTFNTYRYTSWIEDVTNTDGSYTSIPIRRAAVKSGTQEKDNIKMEIELPYNDSLLTEYAFSDSPPQLNFELWRAHPEDYNDTLLMWTGRTLSWTIEGRIGKIIVPSLFYLLQAQCPAPRYQGPCNHVLYDDRCSVDPTSYTESLTVSAINGNTITTDAFTATIAQLLGGEMISTNERRMIVGGDASSNEIEVSSPFSNLSVSDSVDIRQGCDHSFSTCSSKFSNAVNFGGFPYVPGRNPFAGRI